MERHLGEKGRPVHESFCYVWAIVRKLTLHFYKELFSQLEPMTHDNNFTGNSEASLLKDKKNQVTSCRNMEQYKGNYLRNFHGTISYPLTF